MPHTHSPLIEIRQVGRKGRGVFARAKIAKGAEFERVPLIVLPIGDVFGPGRRTKLADYVFKWGRDTVVLALGYGSLYNHSYRPNADFHDRGRLTLVFVARRDIQPGEEITVNYNGDPRSRTRVGFDVEGDGPG